MAGTTTNFGLTLPVGDDLFNPLWSNSNTTKIDAQMKENQNNSITNADCVFNTDKYIITRNDTTGKYFKFIAPVDYVAGYTFQVDGTAYDGIVAGTGDALASSCFIMNHEVIAYIDTTSASLAFLVGSSLPEQIDAHTLDGHEASYFGTASAVQSANDAAVAAGTVANQALEAANAAGMKMVRIGGYAGTTLNLDTPVSLDGTELAKAKMLLITNTARSFTHILPVTSMSDSVTFMMSGFDADSTTAGMIIYSRAGLFTPNNNRITFYGDAFKTTIKSQSSVAKSTSACVPNDIYAIY